MLDTPQYSSKNIFVFKNDDILLGEIIWLNVGVVLSNTTYALRKLSTHTHTHAKVN